jgi:hypothetical protein
MHSVARRSDGSIVAWGDHQYGQLNVPPLPPGLTYVAVAAGRLHSVARRSDGSVVAWGDNYHGQLNVPALPPGVTFVDVSANQEVTAAIIQSGAALTFAPGCPGTLGVARVDSTPPRVGTTAQIAMYPLPQNVAVLVLGFSNVTSGFGPLPLDLTGFGMPGCFPARVVRRLVARRRLGRYRDLLAADPERRRARRNDPAQPGGRDRLRREPRGPRDVRRGDARRRTVTAPALRG